MAYANTTALPTVSFFARIGSALDALATRYKQYRLYRETFDSLNDLSDRELADLGLCRSNLRGTAFAVVYK